MASWFSRWNPINAFPAYHGPYAVGTVDVEISTADLPSPCEEPEGAQPTIAFRIFYPCVAPPSREAERPVRWVPQPQRLTVAALMRFLNLQERTANTLSHLTRQFYWIKINAHRNAPLLDPPTTHGKWPVTFFSHGLAGSRNAYSYVGGDLASNGMIVIALDHRDGSSPVQYVRATTRTEAHTVDAVRISHEPTDKVYEARDKQLRIRMWEMSVVYEALVKINAGERMENLDENTSRRRKDRVEVLQQFDDKLDVHRAGKVSWAGHSFGACTVAQLLKSVYYSRERPNDAGEPLIRPNEDSALLHQITPESSALLLDVWGLPFQSPQQRFLWERPMPSYVTGGPEGANIISILSEGFANWRQNLNINKHVIAAPSRSRGPSGAPQMGREKGKLLPQWARLRDESPSRDSGYASESSRSRDRSRVSGHEEQPPASSNGASPDRQRITQSHSPHMFYVQRSQHFSQSDFGILFPWIARRFTKAEEPERILELNTRAMIQTLREAGVRVAGNDDPDILAEHGGIRSWVSIPVNDDEGHMGESGLTAADRKPSISSIGADSPPADNVATARTEMKIET